MILQIYGIIVLIIAIYFLIMCLCNTFWMLTHTKKPLMLSGPLVSVLIPARNEEAHIERVLRSLLNQSYKNYEVLVLDDNSTDKTWQIIEKMQGEYQKEKIPFRALKGKPLVAGWNGKPFAMQQLINEAHGEILICTDADTEHSFHSVSWGVSNLLLHGADLISGYAKQKFSGLGDALAVSVIFLLTDFVLPIFLTRHVKSETLAAAIGQYIVLRTESLKKIGGYSCLCNACCEDIYLARTMRHAGFTTYFLDAKSVVSCRMYNNWLEAVHGITRNIVCFFNNNLFLTTSILILATIFLFMPFFVAIVAAAMHHPAAGMLLLTVFVYLILWSVVTLDRKLDKRIPVLYSGVFFTLLAIIANSVKKSVNKDGFEWKGRTLDSTPTNKDKNGKDN